MAFEENCLACVAFWREAITQELEFLEVCASTESVEKEGIICGREIDCGGHRHGKKNNASGEVWTSRKRYAP